MNPFNRVGTPRVACIAALALALLAGVSVPVAAQDASSYPNKPVRIFVPYGAGGVGDLTMRLLAQKLSDNTGQQFVIENRPGAGASHRHVGAAPADRCRHAARSVRPPTAIRSRSPATARPSA